MTYVSPIELITEKHMEAVRDVTDNEIFKAVLNVGVNVNKEELIKALEYDRGQYIKGYQDRDKEIVRCKDCKHHGMSDCPMWDGHITEDYMWCYFGERREP